MPLQISPAIVVAIGASAEIIVDRAQELIKQRLHLDELPPIFQFVVVASDLGQGIDSIRRAYSAVVSRRAATVTEQSTGLKVLLSRVESYVVCPLKNEHQGQLIAAAETLKQSSREIVGGGRNAIFLVPAKSNGDIRNSRRDMATAIDREVRTNLLFNRSFFIDGIDELGQTVSEDDLHEVIARYVSLAIASELTPFLRTSPPVYLGEGFHHRGYGSFSCNELRFDPARLGNWLSVFLARDIQKQLFAKTDRSDKQDELRENAQRWFEESLTEESKHLNSQDPGDLTEELGEMDRLKATDLNLDEDFIRKKGQLEEFARSACQSLFHHAFGYQDVLNECLKHAEVALEAYGSKIKQTRKDINELLIKIMLGHSCGDEPVTTSYTTTKKFTGLIWFIAVVAVVITAGLVILANGNLFQHPVITVAITLTIIAAIVVVLKLLPGKVEHHQVTKSSSVPCHEELNRKKRLQKQQKKLQNIHLALFTYLDMANANLEDLRTREIGTFPKSPATILDVDLLDEKFAEYFYASEYKTQNEDIANFRNGEHLNKVHDIAFSFFRLKLIDYLKNYCDQRFREIRDYDLDKALRLHQTINGHHHLLSMASPFWHPVNPDSDKVVLVILGEASGMRKLLADTFGENTIQFVSGTDASVTRLVQIAYGKQMQDILNDIFRESKPEHVKHISR